MRGAWGSLIKLTIYTVVITLLTALLVMVIVNARSGPSTTFRAVFADASGVAANDNVKIAGVSVGRVTGVQVVDHDRALVTFNVEKEVTVPADVTAIVRYENLIGDRYIQLERPSGADPDALGSGATIPEDRTRPAVSLTVLFGGFQPLFDALDPDQVNQFADEVLRVLQGEGGTVNSLLRQTASLTSTIADRDHVIGSMIDNLDSVLGTVARRDGQLSQLVVQLQHFVTGLSANRQAIGQAVSSLGSLTHSVAGLVRGARPALRTDITQLGVVAQHLDAGSATIAEELQLIPGMMNKVDRTASYGSWFQFYLCDLGGALTLPGRGLTTVPGYSNTASRCSQ